MVRWVRRLSIRSRIALGSLLAAAVVVGISAVALDAHIEQIVRGTETTLAEGDLAPFAADIRSNPGEDPDAPAPGVMVLIQSPTGVAVDTMPSELSTAVTTREPSADHFRIETADHVRYTVAAQSVHTAEGTWRLWAARSGVSGDLTLERLDSVLIFGAAAVVLAFGLAAWILAAAALRPVERMRRTAESFGGSAGSGLLPVGPADDELTDLARTLNDMIVSTQSAADRERDMVSAASHELRTPIAVLTTQLELAHRSFGDAQALERAIVAAEESCRRLSRLASNLLELSRLDARRGQAAKSTLAELETEVMEAVDRARLLAGIHGPSIEFASALEDSESMVELSREEFSRILDNLTSNSIRATPESGDVKVCLDQDDRVLRLRVTDTGPGFPADFAPRAFERFARPDQARDEASGGSGLGLALVDAVARAAGGKATIGSSTRENIGAEVVVELPIRREPANM